MVTVTIDGQTVEVEANATLLDAAMQQVSKSQHSAIIRIKK